MSFQFRWRTAPSTRASYDQVATSLRHSAGFHVPVCEQMWIVSPAFTGQRTHLRRLKYLHWCSFQVHSLAASLTKLNSGPRRDPEVGSEVLQQPPERRCAGLVSMPSLRVLHQSRRAWNSLTPATQHFVDRLLTVWTAFSASPLLCR